MEDARLAPRGYLVAIYTKNLYYKLIKPTKQQGLGRFEQVFPKAKDTKDKTMLNPASGISK